MKILALIISFFFLAAPACANEKFLDIQELKTPSGIEIWLVEDHSLPVIAMKFRFRDSGSALDPEGKQGLVQLLSNTMDEGAGDLDSQSFQKELADNSITLRFGGGRDGFGGNLKTLTRNKDKAFNLLKLAMTSPRFDQEPVDRMRESNLTRIRSALSDPDWMAARILNDRAFEGHPYALNSGGTLSSLQTITPDDLRGFQKNWLSKDRLFISVTGDIGAQEVIDQVEKIFEPLAAKAPEKETPDHTIQNGGEVSLYKQDIPQTMINIALPAFGRDDPDYYALQVMNYIFGESGFGSRLMEEAREKRGLTYGIYSSVQNYLHLDALTISTSTKNESAAEMLGVIRTEMKEMQENPVGEQELKDAKSYLTGSLPLSLSSTDRIASMALSLQLEDLPADYLDHYAEKINAVTAKDIQRVAKRVLTSNNMTTVLVGNPANIEPTNIITDLPNAE